MEEGLIRGTAGAFQQTASSDTALRRAPWTLDWTLNLKRHACSDGAGHFEL
jgi:hypothetical protein